MPNFRSIGPFKQKLQRGQNLQKNPDCLGLITNSVSVKDDDNNDDDDEWNHEDDELV